LASCAVLASAGVAHATEPGTRAGATVRAGGGCEATAGEGACRPVTAGATLAREHDFVAGEGGAVLELKGGGVMRLAPGARARVSSTLLVPLGGASPTPAPTVRFDQGAAQVVVAEAVAGRAAVVVRLPGDRSVVVARGTTALRADGPRSLVGSLEGETLVSPDGKAWHRLAEGQAKRFDDAGGRGEREALLAAPAWRPSATLALDLGAKRQPLRLAWAPVDGARAYEVVVRRRGEGAPAFVARVPGDRPAVALGGLPAGAYAATVFPVGSGELEGRASRPLALNVVGLELPAGATTSPEGLVRLGPGQQVRLRHAEGLEASTDLSAPFASAPQAIGLDERGQRLVRLRPPGGAEEAELLLSRRTFRADVEVGPSTATWPSSPVALRVRLVDQDGVPAPDCSSLKPVVTLGLRPLDVHWERVGHELRAQLAPRTLEGPSVVRVEVLDERGALAGRNFLELVPDDARGEGRVASRSRLTAGRPAVP
jgi:hypothetical protein